MSEEDYKSFLKRADKHFSEEKEAAARDRNRLVNIIVIQGMVLTLLIILIALFGSYQLRLLREQVVEISSRPATAVRELPDHTPQNVLQVAGPQGVMGIQGASGGSGTHGAQGLQGAQGEKGDKGEAGADGHTPLIQLDKASCQLQAKYDDQDFWSTLAQLPIVECQQ